MRGILCSFILFGIGNLAVADPPAPQPKSLETMVELLMRFDGPLAETPFRDIVHAVTGRRVVPFDPEQEDHRALLEMLRPTLDSVLEALNAPGHPAHQQSRINEVSGHFEDALQLAIDQHPRYACAYALNALGRIQRSGYPDLRIEDLQTGLVAYLDPKLYAAGSETSTFRSFYFEPKVDTNKILDDAIHLIVGIGHEGRLESGDWHFTGWRLVDLFDFRVRLKAEFQSSNRELYRDELLLETSD